MQDRIEVRLELVDGDFVAQVRRGQDVLQSFASSANGVSARADEMSRALTQWTTNQKLATRESKNFLATLRDVSIVAGAASMAIGVVGRVAGGVLRPIIEVNAELERLEYLMRGMSTAADPIVDAANKIDYLREKAKQTPFAMATIADSMAKLTSTGIDPLNGSMDALIDGVAAFGGTDEAFKRATLAITQMSGKGVIQMEELRQQLGESMPRAVELMARSLGISMPRLIKDISTGTVESKRALELFNMELQRTYGGAALRMMETFSGRMKAFQSSLQDLAKDVGDAGFMEELKNQLRDITAYLNSEQASTFAKSLGSNMAEAMRWIRSTVETVIEFRAEIERTAIVLGTAFVAGRAVSGIASVIGAIRTLNAEMANIATRAALERQLSTATAAATGATGAFSGMARGLGTVSIAVTAFGRALTVATPYIGLLVLALQLGAEWFDIFNSKGSDAYDTVMSIGAASREQYELAKGEAQKRIADLKAQQDEIRAMMGTRDQYVAKMGRRSGTFRGTEAREQVEFNAGQEWDAANFQRIQTINNIQGEITALTRKFEEENTRLVREETARRVETYKAALAEQVRASATTYDKEQVEIQQRYDALENAANKAGKSTQKIQEQRAAELLKSRLKFMDAEIDAVKASLATETALVDQALKARNEGEVKARQGNVNEATRQLNDLLAQRNVLANQTAGSPIAAKGINEAALFDKGQKKLEALQAEAKGLIAELGGANAEVVELQELLANGRYGDLGVEQVKNLVEQITLAKAETEALSELLKGQKEANNDIVSTELRLRERLATARAKLQGRELTETEKLRIKMEAGGYAGLGPNSPIQKGLRDLGASLTTTSGLTDELGRALQERAFGAPTVNAMDTMIMKLGQVGSAMKGITDSAGSLNFSALDGSFGAGAGFGAYNGPMKTSSGDAMLDLIASKESGGDYNATLDHGKWTNGPQNLTSMTLNEVRQLQRYMLSHSENRAKYGDGKGSSALGRYQIVGQTLQGLMEEMGLSGNELYDQKMQDTMARRLLARRGNDVAGLRNEWEGLRGVDAATIQNAYANTNPGVVGLGAKPTLRLQRPANQNASAPTIDNARREAETNFERRLTTTANLEGETVSTEGQAAIKEALESNKRLIEETADEQAGLNKNYAATVKLIKDGTFGKGEGERNPENQRYKDLLESAKALDAAEKTRDDRRKSRTGVENATEKFAEQQIELEKRSAEAFARIADPLEAKTTSAFRNVRKEWESYLGEVAGYYGRESGEYQKALADRDMALKNFRNVEVAEKAAGWAQQTIDIRRSLQTERQSRAEALQENIAEIDRAVAEFQGAEDEKVRLVAAAEEKKAALRAQFAAQDPMGKQMREWSDIQGNLEKASVQWMGSLADGISGLVTGTGDLKSVVDGMLKDIVNMGVKYALSGMMGGKGGAAPLKGAMKKGGMPFKTAHTGGIIGASNLATSFVNPSVFSNARKFHTGGVIGGRSLLPDEVPIIAQRGEGVFTRDQMAALGAGVGNAGGNPVQISSTVHVNANGGTPEQNDDLAKKVSRQVEAQVRAVVQQELRTASRPGGIMRGGR